MVQNASGTQAHRHSTTGLSNSLECCILGVADRNKGKLKVRTPHRSYGGRRHWFLPVVETLETKKKTKKKTTIITTPAHRSIISSCNPILAFSFRFLYFLTSTQEKTAIFLKYTLYFFSPLFSSKKIIIIKHTQVLRIGVKESFPPPHPTQTQNLSQIFFIFNCDKFFGWQRLVFSEKRHCNPFPHFTFSFP